MTCPTSSRCPCCTLLLEVQLRLLSTHPLFLGQFRPLPTAYKGRPWVRQVCALQSAFDAQLRLLAERGRPTARAIVCVSRSRSASPPPAAGRPSSGPGACGANAWHHAAGTRSDTHHRTAGATVGGQGCGTPTQGWVAEAPAMVQPSAAGGSGTAAGGCAAAGEALEGAPPREPLARLPARCPACGRRGACAQTSMCSVGGGALQGQPCLDRGQRPAAGRAPACPATAEALRAELRALQESQAALDLARTAARWDPRPCTTPTLMTSHMQATHAALTLARTAARWDPRPCPTHPM